HLREALDVAAAGLDQHHLMQRFDQRRLRRFRGSFELFIRRGKGGACAGEAERGGKRGYFHGGLLFGIVAGYAVSRNSSTISQNCCGACSNIQWPAWGMTAFHASGTCAGSACRTRGNRPPVPPPRT